MRNVNNVCVDDTNECIANTLDHLTEVSAPCNNFYNTSYSDISNYSLITSEHINEDGSIMISTGYNNEDYISTAFTLSSTLTTMENSDAFVVLSDISCSPLNENTKGFNKYNQQVANSRYKEKHCNKKYI